MRQRQPPHIHHQTPKIPIKVTLTKRAYAFTMDLVTIVLITESLVYSYVGFLKHFLIDINMNIETRLLTLDSLVFMGVFWIYFFLSMYLGEGATPGKFAMGLRVHSPHKTDTHLSLKESLLRTTAYFLCYFTGAVLLALPYFTRNKKGIPDWASKTHVISVSEFNQLRSLEVRPTVGNSKVLTFPEDPMSKKLSKENIKKVA